MNINNINQDENINMENLNRIQNEMNTEEYKKEEAELNNFSYNKEELSDDIDKLINSEEIDDTEDYQEDSFFYNNIMNDDTTQTKEIYEVTDQEEIPVDNEINDNTNNVIEKDEELESILNMNKEIQSNNSEIDEEIKDAFKPEVIREEKSKETKTYKHFDINKKKNNLNFMDKITVDLNNITITEKSPLRRTDDFNTVFDNNIATFSIVCCQSAYSASLSGLTLSEKNALTNSSNDMFQSRQRLYKTIYNKIQSMNIAKPSFDNWLKITAFGDLNTLLFGIYCMTFISNNEFDITCGNCEKVTSIVVDNQTLVEAKDKEVYAKIEEITSHPMSGEELVEHSLVHKNQRIMLNESKVIVDIHTPSLYDHLMLIKQSNPKVLREYADTFSAMLFIGHIYMLDVEGTYRSGQPTYYELTSKQDILSTLIKLSNNDGEQLESAIEKKLGKYKIDYEIHNAKCTHCGNKIPNMPVDMEEILFTRIQRQAKMED